MKGTDMATYICERRDNVLKTEFEFEVSDSPKGRYQTHATAAQLAATLAREKGWEWWRVRRKVYN